MLASMEADYLALIHSSQDIIRLKRYYKQRTDVKKTLFPRNTLTLGA